jgi:DNA-binding CsgD family transcriptional regulator
MHGLCGRLAPPRVASLLPSGADPLLTLRWYVELAMLWVRWSEVPLCLALPLLFPGVPLLPALLLALGLVLGNASLTRLLYQPDRLRLVGSVATALEWAVALGMIALSAHRPLSNAPAGLLLLIPLAGLRYGWRGLLGASAAATVILAALTTLHLHLLPTFPPATVLREGISWAVLLTLTLSASGALLVSGRSWYSLEERRWRRERTNLRRQEHGLSFREGQVLGLLAREDLTTYGQIGKELGISTCSIKTYVQRIGTKLGASGRGAIVATAGERGLLFPEKEIPVDELTRMHPNDGE